MVKRSKSTTPARERKMNRIWRSLISRYQPVIYIAEHISWQWKIIFLLKLLSLSMSTLPNNHLWLLWDVVVCGLPVRSSGAWLPPSRWIAQFDQHHLGGGEGGKLQMVRHNPLYSQQRNLVLYSWCRNLVLWLLWLKIGWRCTNNITERDKTVLPYYPRYK